MVCCCLKATKVRRGGEEVMARMKMKVDELDLNQQKPKARWGNVPDSWASSISVYGAWSCASLQSTWKAPQNSVVVSRIMIMFSIV